MRLFATGGTGLLGRALRPLADAAGHELVTPRHDELDLFDPAAVAEAVRGFDAVLHLATRVRSFEHVLDRKTRRENDRLRVEASKNLVDGALAAGVQVYVVPTATFLYPEGPVTEETSLDGVLPEQESTLAAELEASRFGQNGGRGVVLRLGWVDGPGTGWGEPLGNLGATIHVHDAARALLEALSMPSGVYNVCRDDERVSNERFVAAVGWHPEPWILPRRRDVTAEGEVADLADQCQLLRSLHRRGDPLLLPNAWDASTARAVVAAGYPVVATTSGGVANSLGYDDHEAAPASEMFAAAARIVRGVEVPVTVDAEAGYGLSPTELVEALRASGAAGCNLEDTDYATTWGLRDIGKHAEWLTAVRRAADEAGYPLVINARIDCFVGAYLGGGAKGHQEGLVAEAVQRAHAYREAGADCVYPILLWEPEALQRFMAEVDGPVNVVQLSESPSLRDLSAWGVARVSWGYVMHTTAMACFERQIASLRD